MELWTTARLTVHIGLWAALFGRPDGRGLSVLPHD